tara:strand:+ start:259 stop:492 length:234 start_codon:yes stop_codon:yes gene_type:complete
MTNQKRMILFTNRNTERSIYLLVRDGETHLLDTEDTPEDGKEQIEFMMNLNHVVLRAAAGTKSADKAITDMEKLIAG